MAFRASRTIKRSVMPSSRNAKASERPFAVGGETDDVAAAVVGIAAPFDQPALLELVEQPHQLAAVVPEGVGDRSLRFAGALVEHEHHGVVVRMQARLLVRPHGALLGGEAEALEEERRRGDELGRQPGMRRGRCLHLHRHAQRLAQPSVAVIQR